jgi:hypothetical protein
VTTKICEKLASAEDATESLTQACVASDLAHLAARSMHDLVVMCDPAIGKASADDSSERYEQLRSDVAGVQESVGAAKRDLTSAMTIVAGHVSEVSRANSASVQDTVLLARDQTLRLEIERALEAGKPYGVLCLPQAFGGQLEVVRRIVIETIRSVTAAGGATSGASAKLAEGDARLTKGQYKKAFRLYAEAYVAAVGIGTDGP